MGVEGQLHFGVVGALHALGGGPLPFREQVHKLFVGVGLLPGFTQLGLGHAGADARGCGSEDAAGHGGQGGRKGNLHLLPRDVGELLFNFGGMPVGAADSIGAHAAHNFG